MSGKREPEGAARLENALQLVESCQQIAVLDLRKSVDADRIVDAVALDRESLQDVHDIVDPNQSAASELIQPGLGCLPQPQFSLRTVVSPAAVNSSIPPTTSLACLFSYPE